MEIRAANQMSRQKSSDFYKKLFKLTTAGGIAFWITSIATSLLPIAAKYRSAFSNWSPQTVWVGSLFAGMLIGCCVSFFLLRLYAKLPAKSPVLKSVLLSSAALVLSVIMIDVPMMLRASSDALPYFFIGAAFNSVRFLILGFVIGWMYLRVCGNQPLFNK